MIFKGTFPIFEGLHSVQKRAHVFVSSIHNMSKFILKVLLLFLWVG